MTITEVTGRQAIYMLDIEHGYLVGRNGAGNQTGSECRKLQNVCKGIGWEGEQRLKKQSGLSLLLGLISISFITILINLMILEL